MPMCVCGHNEDEHHLATMSVPLTNPVPIYPVTYPAFAGQPHPTATYERLECGCGCTLFEGDGGRDVVM